MKKLYIFTLEHEGLLSSDEPPFYCTRMLDRDMDAADSAMAMAIDWIKENGDDFSECLVEFDGDMVARITTKLGMPLATITITAIDHHGDWHLKGEWKQNV